MHLVGWKGTRVAEKSPLIYPCTCDGPAVTHILQPMTVKMSHLCTESILSILTTV